MGKRSLTEAGYKVILALQINGVRYDYVCIFKINNVDVTEKEEQQPEKNPNNGRGRRGGAF